MSLLLLQPHSLEEALEALAHYGEDAKVLAGGTALTLLLRNRLIAPEVLISIEHIPILNYMHIEASGLHPGR